MLLHLLPLLRTKRIVLASGSPRRQELLATIGLSVDVIPSAFEENLDKSTHTPTEYVVATARGKALEVADRLEREERTPDLLIGADTVVVVDEHIMEKPSDRAHALEMIKSLSGRSHYVVTGVILVQWGHPDGRRVVEFHEQTKVTFAELSEEEITAYVDSGEPMDKAGGYGIQGLGGALVQSLDGCYFNVVGFPVHSFCRHVADMYA